MIQSESNSHEKNAGRSRTICISSHRFFLSTRTSSSRWTFWKPDQTSPRIFQKCSRGLDGIFGSPVGSLNEGCAIILIKDYQQVQDVPSPHFFPRPSLPNRCRSPDPSFFSPEQSNGKKGLDICFDIQKKMVKSLVFVVTLSDHYYAIREIITIIYHRLLLLR